MNGEELKRACEQAGLMIIGCADGPCVRWPIPCSQGEHQMSPLRNEWWQPIIMAYVAELMTAKAQGIWEVETAIGNRYGATCWECTITDHVGARRVIASECLFIVPHSMERDERGPGRIEQRRTDDNGKTWDEVIIWCRGEGDDDPFCGRAEVEIRACMEVLS